MPRQARYGPYNYERVIGGRNYKLLATPIQKWAEQTQQELEAVARLSVQDVITQAQQTVADGGTMPVKTGFLRASGRISFTGMPSGPVRGDLTTNNAYAPNTSALILQAGAWDTENSPRLFFGWTANYAIYQEAKKAFLYKAIQRWQEFVTKNVQFVRNHVGK